MNNFTVALLVTSILSTLGMASIVAKYLEVHDIGLILLFIVGMCVVSAVKLRWRISSLVIVLFVFILLGSSYSVPQSILFGGLLCSLIFGLYLSKGLRWPSRKITGLTGQKLLESVIWLVPTALTISSSWTSSGFAYRVLQTRDMHLDAYFHASLTSMLQQYGVASTGVDGLQQIRYHDLLHRCIATIANFSGYSPLGLFSYIHFIVVLPILYSVFGKLSSTFCDVKKSAFEAIGFTAIIIMCFYRIFRISGFGDIFMHSETQGLALGLLFLYIVTPVECHNGKHPGLRFLFISCTTIVVLGLLKGPFAILGLIVAIARVAKVDWSWKFRALMGGTLLLVTLLTLTKYFGGDSGTSLGLFPYAMKSKVYQSAIQLLGGGPSSIAIGILAHLVLFYLPCIAQVVVQKKFRFHTDLVLLLLISFSIVFESIIDFDGPNVFWVTCVPVLYSLCWIASRFLESKTRIPIAIVAGLFLCASVYVPGIRRRLNRYAINPSANAVTRITSLESLRGEPKTVFNGTKVKNDLPVNEEARAMPLVFVAISEHPWSGLVAYPISTEFEGYGYGKLRQGGSQNASDVYGVTVIDSTWLSNRETRSAKD
jgi:hypothetical protein